jgi:hypothetical protein
VPNGYNGSGFVEGKDFIISYWSEFKNYQCTKCQYDSLWWMKMVKHLANGKHKWAFPRPEGSAPLVDNNGEPPY